MPDDDLHPVFRRAQPGDEPRNHRRHTAMPIHVRHITPEQNRLRREGIQTTEQLGFILPVADVTDLRRRRGHLRVFRGDERDLRLLAEQRKQQGGIIGHATAPWRVVRTDDGNGQVQLWGKSYTSGGNKPIKACHPSARADAACL